MRWCTVRTIVDSVDQASFGGSCYGIAWGWGGEHFQDIWDIFRWIQGSNLSLAVQNIFTVVYSSNFEDRVVRSGSRGHHKSNIRAPLIAYQLRKYFLSQSSPERIFLWHVWTLDAGHQTTLGSPVSGPIFSMRCCAAWDCDVTSTVDKCCLAATKITCRLLSAKYYYISLAAGSGCLRIEHRWTDYVVWGSVTYFCSSLCGVGPLWRWWHLMMQIRLKKFTKLNFRSPLQTFLISFKSLSTFRAIEPWS
jgi:hypothetical protein